MFLPKKAKENAQSEKLEYIDEKTSKELTENRALLYALEIENLRTLAASVDNGAFGTSAFTHAESKGSCGEKMQVLTTDLKDTINCMADAGERLLLFLLQAGINLEEMDDYLAAAMNKPSSGGA